MPTRRLQRSSRPRSARNSFRARAVLVAGCAAHPRATSPNRANRRSERMNTMDALDMETELGRGGSPPDASRAMRDAALRLLGRREYSTLEMRRKLVARGYQPPQV